MSNAPDVGRKKSMGINAVLNVIKQCSSILFPLITFPYVSRVLGAENYGKYNFGNSIISYLTMIAALGVSTYAIRECAKVRTEKKELNRIANEIYTINIISTAVSILCFVGMLFLWERVADIRVLIAIQFLPVIFATIGADWMNVVHDDYLYITARYIVFHIVSLALIFIFVRGSEDFVIYAAISSFSLVGPNIVNIWYIRKKYGIQLRIVGIHAAKKHFLPILILFASTIALHVYVSSDVFLLGLIKGDFEVGIYSVSTKIYSLVKQLINSIIMVAIPTITYGFTKGRRDEVNKTLSRILGFVISLMIPLCIGGFVFSEQIVLIISGEEYAQAASSLRFLMISLFFACTACFYVNLILLPLGKDKHILISMAISAGVNILLNLLLIPEIGSTGAAITTLIAEMIMAVYGFILSRKKAVISINRFLLTGILTGAVTILVWYIVSALKLSNILQLISAIMVSGVAYLLLFVVVCKIRLSEIKNMFFSRNK